MKSLKIIGIGLIVGILLLIAKITFHINDDIFMKFYVSASIALIVLVIIINVLYYKYYQKKIHRYITLAQSTDFDEGITALNKIQTKVKTKTLKNIVSLVRAALYDNNGEHQKSLEILENLDEKKLNKGLFIIYKLNLCSCYFSNNDNEKAIAIYDKYEEVFKQLENNNNFSEDSSSIFLTHAYAQLYKNNVSSAEEYIKKAKKSDKQKKYKPAIRRLENAIKSYKNAIN